MEEIDILDSIHDAVYSSEMDFIALTVDILFRFEFVWIAIGLALFLSKRYRTVGTVLLLAMMLEICTVLLLKMGVDRVRPVEEYDIDGLITSFSTSSFPSGHVAQWFCAATVFAVFRKDSIPFMLILAAFVSFTRLYLYAHYPTDVIAGAVIGMACAFIAVFAVLRAGPRTVFLMNGTPDGDPQ